MAASHTFAIFLKERLAVLSADSGVPFVRQHRFNGGGNVLRTEIKGAFALHPPADFGQEEVEEEVLHFHVNALGIGRARGFFHVLPDFFDAAADGVNPQIFPPFRGNTSL